MIDDEISHTFDLIRAHTRRIRILERQAAEQGRAVDPSITIEIHDTKEEIEKLRSLITSVAPHPSGKSPVILSLTNLPLPLEKYDSFFLQLSQSFDAWDRNPKNFKLLLLAGLASALSAKHAFIVHYTGSRWETLPDSNIKTQPEKEILSSEDHLRELLHIANRPIDNEDKNWAAEQPNVGFGLLPNSAQVCLFASYQEAEPARILVVYDMNTDFESDTVVAATINTLFKETGYLENPPRTPEK